MGWTNIRYQIKELFAAKLDSAEGASGTERKMSAASTSSMKSKWLKAFKSLKTPPPNGKEQEKEKRNGKEMNMMPSDSAHQFQEYTYKKITPCDVCSQVLRGHTRQGLKCRLCKLNVHIDCQDRAAKCQTKSRLLRRQKSSSEIETRGNPADEEGAYPGEGNDATYQVLKAANEISSGRTVRRPTSGPPQQPHSASSAEQLQYAAGTRPFGQPLVLQSAPTTPSSPATPSPRAGKRSPL